MRVNNICKCPYCFGKFAPVRAMFKSTTSFDKMDQKEGEDQLYNKRTDLALEEFRNGFPGTQWHSDNEDEDEENYDDHVILCAFEDQVHAPVARTEDGDVDFSDFKGDVILKGRVDPEEIENGYVSRLIDAYGRETRIRICPHCHNLLPNEFGKYETKYIAVVGITSSGKTVYLSQLFKQIDTYLAHANLVKLSVDDEIEKFVKGHQVKIGEQLPGGTTAHHLTLPIPMVIQNIKTKTRYMLIFYDIAGENCVNPARMAKFGPFVCNADGIIMITDPKQFNQLFVVGNNDQAGEDTLAPGRVLQAMYEAFIADQVGNTSTSVDIPLAAAISKSDLLRGIINDRSRIFSNTDYEEYESNGFAYDDFNSVNTEISMKLRTSSGAGGSGGQGAIYKNLLDAEFSQHAFFAFSALNCMPPLGGQPLLEQPNPLRLEDPLIWLMYKMGMVEQARKKGQKQNNGLFGLFQKK